MALAALFRDVVVRITKYSISYLSENTIKGVDWVRGWEFGENVLVVQVVQTVND